MCQVSKKAIDGGYILGDLKAKVRYILCSNNLTDSMLKIYFGIKKEGISHIREILKSEHYNRRYRKPWRVSGKEILKQRSLFLDDKKKILIGIDCERSSYDQICSSVISVYKQSVQDKCHIIYIKPDAKYKSRLEKELENIYRVKPDYADTYEFVKSFIENNSFDYYGEIKAGDRLHPYTLFFLMKECSENGLKKLFYYDEWYFEKSVKRSFAHNYKSDFSIMSLYSKNYIGNFFFTASEVYNEIGGFDECKKDVRYYDYLLRFIENEKKKFYDTNKSYSYDEKKFVQYIKTQICHIAEPMYYKQCSRDIMENDTFRIENDLGEIKVLREHFDRCSVKAEISYDEKAHIRHNCFKIEKSAKVSIIIPNKEHKTDLKRCIDSILKRTGYPYYEIIIVENGSTSDEIKDYYNEISKIENIQVCRWDKGFNYSAINNYGVRYASGEYIVLLNNDIEIISEKWIEEMLMYAQMPDIGAVGCMLYYPDDTVQHAGVILGIGGIAGHSHKHFKAGEKGYNERLMYVQELNAVTAACMMTKKSIHDKLGGLDEKFEVAFNDIDYCMRIRQAGFSIVFTPYAEMYHYESVSRGYETTEAKEKRFRGETERFLSKWGCRLKNGDEFYNPHLTLRYENFELK